MSQRMVRSTEGGYSGSSNWHLHDVPTMWTLLANQQSENHWRQVAGWRKTSELTTLHLSRLRSYRERLAAAWPPEKSPAAAAYLARLDHLIDTVGQTYEVAAANYTTLSTAVSTLHTGRHKLKKIHDEYVAKQRQKQEHEKRVGAFPGPWGSTLPPPVTDADLEHLNVRARSVMNDLGGTLIEARAQIRRPPPYQPRTTRVPGNPDTYASTNGALPPPVIPPIVPVPMPAPAITSPPRPMGPAAPAGPAVPVSPGGGPVLGGTGAVIAPPTPTAPAGPAATPPTAVTGSGTGSLVPPVPTAAPGAPPRSGIGGTAPVSPPAGRGTPAKPGPGGLGGGSRALPPGGMIGGPPGAGIGQPVGTQAARRVNPVGGVIGGQRPVMTPDGLASGSGQPLATAAGRSGGSDREGRRWDPDHPWEIEEGVDPVVLPPREVDRTDPGPAIGLDR